MSDKTTNKTMHLYKLMEIFLEKGEITPYDKDVLERLDNCNPRTLGRYLKNLEELYHQIIQIEKQGKKNVWKLVKVSDILEKFIANNKYDLHNLFELAKEFDSEIFKELEKGTLKKLATNESVFVFKNYIMEELDSAEAKKNFKNLKEAVKNREYRDIYYCYNKDILYEDVKPLKLAFMDNNWYIAVLTKEKEFKFLRLSFIKDVKKRPSQGRFQSVDIEKYLEFIKKAQNSMTLYNVKPKVAKIKAKKGVAKYFKEGMKRHLPSQKFVKELDSGEVIFTIEYTQELEVLPFIQKWLPDLVILSPKELQRVYIKKLQDTLENHIGQFIWQKLSFFSKIF